LTLLSENLAEPTSNGMFPLLEPLDPVDTPLTPGENISQLVALASTWTDLSSLDPLILNLSRQVLALEIAYAAFCGVGHVIIPGPKRQNADGFAQYARAIQEALNIGNYMSIQILLPMEGTTENAEEEMGALGSFARTSHPNLAKLHIKESPKLDLMGSWDAWNIIRTLCKYSSRLFVGKKCSNPLHRLEIGRCRVT
jgi:protein arginine N-methyltransferase 5